MTKQPSYRFVGYIEPWEEKKFQELSTKKGKKNTNGESYPVYSVSNQSGLIPQSEQFEGSRLDNLDKKSYKIVEPNEFAYNPARINVGSIAFNNLNHRVIVSSLYVIFILDKKIDNSFAIQFIKSDKFIKEVKRNTEGSVREYLFYENFSNIRLPYPPSLPEQTAIGSFFQDIDQLISLQQRKLEVLKEQKKTYLKLLFPAKGQTKPALRFSGFEDEWQRQNFGDYLVEYNEKTVVENQHELLSSTNNGIEPRVGRVSGESNLGYKVLKKDMIVLSPQNLWLGNINYNSKYDLGIVSPSYKIFNIENVDKKFISILIRHPYMIYEYGQASVQGASVVRRNLDIDLFNSIQILLPSLEEQSLIGSFFQDLDKAITKHEEKVNQLKESKQTLLRKMFI